jgi:hypothetical protein
MKKIIWKLLGFAALLLFAIALYSTTSVRSARLTSKLTVFENLITPTTSTYWEINGLDETMTYADGGTRNDADIVYADTVINDGTLDLTSLTNSLGESLDLTGYVIVAAKFSLEDDAAATMTISQGASDPYPLFGSTFSIELAANQSLLFKADTVLIPVANDAKAIDYDSSNDSTVLSIILLTADGYN